LTQWEDEFLSVAASRRRLLDHWSEVREGGRWVLDERAHDARIRAAVDMLEAGEAFVYLNSAPWRADAIIIHSGDVVSRHLDLDGGALSLLADPLYEDLRRAEGIAASIARQRSVALTVRSLAEFKAYDELRRQYAPAINDANDRLVQLLQQAWELIARPVLETLRLREPGRWSSAAMGRVWWCPVGVFNGIPIHAAGSRELSDWVSDSVVSSYAPSVDSWLTTRNAPVIEKSDDRVVVVLASEEAGYQYLAAAERELSAIMGAVGRDSTEVLRGRQATRASVLEATSRHRFFHYAGHGISDFFDPSSGGVILTDGPLTFDDVLEAAGPGELAFLSACRTAEAERMVSDEVLHPVIAWLYRGYRHVVGTMWSIFDSAPVDLVSILYAELAEAGLGSGDPPVARALNTAARTARDKGVRALDWAGFVHMGR
jgi:hypothetical protein